MKLRELPNEPLTAIALFNRSDVKKKFQKLLGNKAQSFITSVLQIIAADARFNRVDPISLYNACSMAATLDLPVNKELGYCYIRPAIKNYQDKTGKWLTKEVAEFILSAKGFKQLAIRSGQFLRINESDVREGEIKSIDNLSGDIQFQWLQNEAERLSKPVVGYVSYFKLVSGFENTFYMSVDKLKAHAKKYSDTYGQKDSKWYTEFEMMCLKTVTKLNLSKNGPLSVKMSLALKTDQAALNDEFGESVDYIDNETVDALPINKELERMELMISDCLTIQDLDHLQILSPDIDVKLFDAQREKIKTKNNGKENSEKSKTEETDILSKRGN